MNQLAIVKVVNNLTVASKRDELVECVNDVNSASKNAL